jgi:hypothetical protein
VARVRWLEAADHAMTLAVEIVDNDLDRLNPLGRAISGSATPTNELGQLTAQIVRDRFMEAHPHKPTLVRSQTEPIVETERDMHAVAHQAARTIRSPQAPELLGAPRALCWHRIGGHRRTRLHRNLHMPPTARMPPAHRTC